MHLGFEHGTWTWQLYWNNGSFYYVHEKCLLYARHFVSNLTCRKTNVRKTEIASNWKTMWINNVDYVKTATVNINKLCMDIIESSNHSLSSNRFMKTEYRGNRYVYYTAVYVGPSLVHQNVYSLQIHCFHHDAGADPRIVRIGTAPPLFWQINHANSAYFRLFWGYFRVISATRPPFGSRPPPFLHILDPPLMMHTNCFILLLYIKPIQFIGW